MRGRFVVQFGVEIFCDSCRLQCISVLGLFETYFELAPIDVGRPETGEVFEKYCYWGY